MLEEAAVYVLGGLLGLAGMILTFSKVYALLKTNILSGVEAKMEVATSETDIEIEAIMKTLSNNQKWIENVEKKVDKKTDVSRIETLEKKFDALNAVVNQLVGKIGK